MNQNGITAAALYAASYREWDMSSYVDLGTLLRWPVSFQITADAINLFDAKQRSYFEYTDATYTEYDPGRELTDRLPREILVESCWIRAYCSDQRASSNKRGLLEECHLRQGALPCAYRSRLDHSGPT